MAIYYLINCIYHVYLTVSLLWTICVCLLGFGSINKASLNTLVYTGFFFSYLTLFPRAYFLNYFWELPRSQPPQFSSLLKKHRPWVIKYLKRKKKHSLEPQVWSCLSCQQPAVWIPTSHSTPLWLGVPQALDDRSWCSDHQEYSLSALHTASWAMPDHLASLPATSLLLT